MREEQIQEAPVKVLLVGVDVGEEPDFERSMEELASLAEAAEKEVVGQIVQRLDHVNKALYIGTGKVTEVRRLAEECGAQEIVFDNSLTPSQVRNLGNELELHRPDESDPGYICHPGPDKRGKITSGDSQTAIYAAETGRNV